MLQAVLTLAFPGGGHAYRDLAAGNGIPRSTCHTHIQEGIKVLARRALPLTEVVPLAARPYLIVDGVDIPTERVKAEYTAKQSRRTPTPTARPRCARPRRPTTRWGISPRPRTPGASGNCSPTARGTA
jgi:hypothetical protein